MKNCVEKISLLASSSTIPFSTRNLSNSAFSPSTTCAFQFFNFPTAFFISSSCILAPTSSYIILYMPHIAIFCATLPVSSSLISMRSNIFWKYYFHCIITLLSFLITLPSLSIIRVHPCCFLLFLILLRIL